MKRTPTLIRLAVLGMALFLLLVAVGCDKGQPSAQTDWQLKISADPGEIILDGTSVEGTSTIEALVFDKTGNPQKNVDVKLKVTSGDGTITKNDTYQKTDDRGRIVDILTARSDTAVTAYAGSLEKAVTVKVTDGNKSPVAVLTATPKDKCLVNKTVTFSGSGSTDPDDGIKEYQFTVQSNDPDPGEQAVVVRAWDPAATFAPTYRHKQTLTMVKLEVKDYAGNVSAAFLEKPYEIVDNEGAPTAKLNLDGARIQPIDVSGPPYPPQFPLGHRWPVTASACQSSDVGDGKIVTYVFSWGDGSADTYEDAPVCSTTHSYNAPGEYNVKLIVYDDGDGTCTMLIPFETDTCASRGISTPATAKLECLPITK